MSITARRSVSFAENIPNWISWIVRVGALEYAKLRFAMAEVAMDQVARRPM